MNTLLQQIFSNRFCELSKKTKPQKIRKIWKNYLEVLGVDRKGKLMTMLIPCPDDQVEIKDPMGEDVVIRINKELALKIATLGFTPELEENNESRKRRKSQRKRRKEEQQ
jgi:hypothetical protein